RSSAPQAGAVEAALAAERRRPIPLASHRLVLGLPARARSLRSVALERPAALRGGNAHSSGRGAREMTRHMLDHHGSAPGPTAAPDRGPRRTRVMQITYDLRVGGLPRVVETIC